MKLNIKIKLDNFRETYILQHKFKQAKKDETGLFEKWHPTYIDNSFDFITDHAAFNIQENKEYIYRVIVLNKKFKPFEIWQNMAYEDDYLTFDIYNFNGEHLSENRIEIDPEEVDDIRKF